MYSADEDRLMIDAARRAGAAFENRSSFWARFLDARRDDGLFRGRCAIHLQDRFQRTLERRPIDLDAPGAVRGPPDPPQPQRPEPAEERARAESDDAVRRPLALPRPPSLRDVRQRRVRGRVARIARR